MAEILMIYICNLLAAVLVKGTFIGVMYGRRDYVYYNFLTNIITSTIFVIGMYLLFLLGMTEIYETSESAESGGVVLLILCSLAIIILVTETIIYMKVFNASKLRAIFLSIITNIITFIVLLLLSVIVYRVFIF